jgi:hypothetical protein
VRILAKLLYDSFLPVIEDGMCLHRWVCKFSQQLNEWSFFRTRKPLIIMRKLSNTHHWKLNTSDL